MAPPADDAASFRQASPPADDAASLRQASVVTAPEEDPEPLSNDDAVQTPADELQMTAPVSYIPPIFDIQADAVQKWTTNEFILTMRDEEDPAYTFHNLYTQTLSDLELMTSKTKLQTIGPKNQVHYITQRMWARLAHLCLTKQNMGAVLYGPDNPLYDDSNLINTMIWHIFQQKRASTSPMMSRMQNILHEKTYDLRHLLLNFEIGMHIINMYDNKGESSILMATGNIDINMYIRASRHLCPLCKTAVQIDLLQFEKQVFEPGSCFISGSEICADKTTPVTQFPCAVCTPKTGAKICRFCMPQFIMSSRI